MWVWQQCIQNIQAPCNPTSWADIGEMFLVAVGAVAALPALAVLLAGLGGLCTWLSELRWPRFRDDRRSL